MAFTLNKRVEKVVFEDLEQIRAQKQKEAEERLQSRTQLQIFYDLAKLARDDSFGMRGRGGKTHNPQWYMDNGVLFSTLQWLSREGYIGKNIHRNGTKDVYINWKNNPQKDYSKPLEELDLTLF